MHASVEEVPDGRLKRRVLYINLSAPRFQPQKCPAEVLQQSKALFLAIPTYSSCSSDTPRCPAEVLQQSSRR